MDGEMALKHKDHFMLYCDTSSVNFYYMYFCYM